MGLPGVYFGVGKMIGRQADPLDLPNNLSN